MMIRKTCYILSLLSACTSLAFANDSSGEKWLSLFNGKDLEGWTPKFADFPLGENLDNIFRVEDGLLKVSYEDSGDFKGHFGHLFYQTPFSHYRIRAEFRFTGEQQKGAPAWAFRNNGLMLHSQAPETMGIAQKFPNSIEMQMSGADPKNHPPTADRAMGCLFTPGTKVMRDGEEYHGGSDSASGEPISGLEWVTVEAEVRGGEEIIHFVNGEEVLRYQKPMRQDGTPLTSGYIAIQAESHPTEFRKIELLVLEEKPSSEKN